MHKLFVAEPFVPKAMSYTEMEYRKELQTRCINGQRYVFLTNMNIEESRSIIEETIACFEKGDFIIDNEAYYFNNKYEKIMLPDDFALLCKPDVGATMFWKIYRNIEKERKLCLEK